MPTLIRPENKLSTFLFRKAYAEFLTKQVAVEEFPHLVNEVMLTRTFAFINYSFSQLQLHTGKLKDLMIEPNK